MPCQLPADCLNEIFEYLEKDKITLHSCLLVNRLWCEVSVRILWRNIWNFNYTYPQIFITLIACLPNESKDLLHRNGIFISTPTSKPPLFNYASFFKVLSIEKIYNMTKNFFQQSITLGNLNNKIDLLIQEISKMFMNQVSSLKKLNYHMTIHYLYYEIPNNVTFNTFTRFPGARDCLTNLSELNCSSDVHSEFFYHLSQICHNIQSLNIQFRDTTSNGLNDLISSQNRLKYLLLFDIKDTNLVKIIPSLTKHSSALTKLEIDGRGPLSFINKFTNLQVLILSCFDRDSFKDLQYAIEKLIIILKINGENLKEFYICTNTCHSLNLAIAKFCPNLKSLHTLFMKDEIETLKIIFDSCQQLENLGTWCGTRYLNEEELLEIVVKHSPENFHELNLCYEGLNEKLPSKDLETFFTSWRNRIPQKSFSLTFILLWLGKKNIYYF